MNTPILDFVRKYDNSGMKRFHMPGHKGRRILGCENWDITEVQGADALYEAEGIIAESEANATKLFGSGRTLYSTEGSSQCIRAMLYLAITNRKRGTAPVIVAARNVHKAFVYAAALLDFEVVWLWPEESDSLCGCPVSEEQLEETLSRMSEPPAAVYLTSPDYLGGMADISAMAGICHRYETLLLIDNAHGAYLHFLQPSLHPLDLGADMCCDSAHKTLPVLTGGAYLHISDRVSGKIGKSAKMAMALFGSTSPSYLILASLDACNAELADGFRDKLKETVKKINLIKEKISANGWMVEESDPLRITLRAPEGMTGDELARNLRCEGIECEFADDTFLVMMLTAGNDFKDMEKMLDALGKNVCPPREKEVLQMADGEQKISIREAIFLPHEMVPVERALGRICGAPTVSCPPAIPIAVSGEIIGDTAVRLFRRYGIENVDVIKTDND